LILGEFKSQETRNFLSAAYADTTWRKFDSAAKSYAKFEVEENITTEWPLSEENLLLYATWGFARGGLKASSIESYLGLLKTIHKFKSLDTSAFDSFALKSLIRGKENLEIYSQEVKATRKVMSLPLLKILGHAIAKKDWSENSKQVVWGAATLAFFGSLRCGEILPQNENSCSPPDTLLWEDLKFYGEDHILIHVKNAKTRVKGGEFVDIFSFEGHGVCPIKAMKKLKENAKNYDPKSPVFCFDTGVGLTRRKLNGILCSLLEPYIGHEAKNITGHSFRAAIPAVLARFPDLCKSHDIMGWGRWKSDAYLLYTRLKVDQKRCTFVTITSLLNM